MCYYLTKGDNVVKSDSISFIVDLGNALEGSGIYSSATRLAKGLKEIGYKVTIKTKKTAAIVHLHTALPQSCFRVLRYRAMRSRKKIKYPILVIHGHTTVEDFVNSFLFSNQLKPILKWYLPYYYKLADHLIAVSDHNKRLLMNYGIDSAKISVISNGIKLGSAHYSEKIRAAARKKLGLDNEKKLIIGVGISIYRKGIDKFVDIAEQLPDIQFIWIGRRISTAFLAHSALIKKKYKYAKKLQNCHFCGYVSLKTLWGLFNAADAFLYPTREENQGISFLEAILYGKPAIISKHPVFDEFIDGVHCLKAEFTDDYVTQIKRLFNDQDLSINLVKNAQQYLEFHDITKSIKKIADLYNSLIYE